MSRAADLQVTRANQRPLQSVISTTAAPRLADRRTSGARLTTPRASHGSPSAEASQRIHWTRTLIAKGAAPLARDHLRFRPPKQQSGALHCFLVDCSASMSSARQLALAKGLLMQLIHKAYQQRAEVAIIGFAGHGATMHLPPTLARPLTSQHIERWLQPIRASGATPFSQGVTAASGLLSRASRARPAQSRSLWLLTDGRSTESPARPANADVVTVIDCEHHRVPLNRCVHIAQRWNASYERLADYALETHSENSQ